MSETLELTKALIRCRSITPDDAGCMELVVDRLQPLGFTVEFLDFGSTRNLYMRHGTEAPVLGFVGHTDVVPTGPEDRWSSPPFEPTIRDGLLYGRGAADMKSGVAAMVTALARFVSDHPDHPGSLALLLTSDEEGAATDGIVKVIEVLEARQERMTWCVIGEPSSFRQLGDTLRIGRRGSLNGTLKVHGVQGHVAYPEKALNPIHALAPALSEMLDETWDQGNEFFPPTRLQVSNLNAGTGAENVIPGPLEMKFNFRFSTATTEADLKARVSDLLERHEVPHTLEWKLSGQPFLTRGTELLAATQSALNTVLGIEARPDTGGGTSDGRFIAPTGAEILELGPLNGTIHKLDECIPVADIEPLSVLYETIMGNLLVQKKA